VQLPAWNEALGLPRPWDQQWSLRLQQIAAFETDMLDYEDIFDGSTVIAEKVAQLATQIRGEIGRIERLGGAGAQSALEYMKERLVLSNAARLEAIERGDEIRVGVNAYTETEVSPLTEGEGQFVTADAKAEQEQIARLAAWRAGRDQAQVERALAGLSRAAKDGSNIMPASIACATAGVTTGEWADALRRIFGEYRAPTGIAASGPARNDERIVALRAEVEAVSKRLGRPLTLLVAKPGLDGHSNGAEQIALRARDAGIQVVYDGIRHTPEEIVEAARQAKPHVIGLSVLSGSHLALARELAARLAATNLSDVKIVLGGIVPPEDETALKSAGIAAVFSPKDYDLDIILRHIIGLFDTA
jgi:(2R)-ethylmalonyl-CoA mutase